MKIVVGTTNKAKIDSVIDALKQCKCLHNGDGESTNNDAANFQVLGVPGVDSGVSPQPFSTRETRLGAYNRAKGALEKYQKQNQDDEETELPDFGVGLEGGIEIAESYLPCATENNNNNNNNNNNADFFVVGWVCVIERKTGKIAWGSSARVELPRIFREKLEIALHKTSCEESSNGEAKHENGTGCEGKNSFGVLSQFYSKRDLGQVIDEVGKKVDLRSSLGVEGVMTNGTILRADAYAHGIIFAFSKFLMTPSELW